jgi:hypothetical protein
MHEHDTDIIMALAEGSLDPSAAVAAEADLASCATCRADLELQRVAVAALRSAPPAEMNDIERARLHRNLRDELELAVPTPGAMDRGRDARLYRLFAGLAGAAAVLVAVVLIGPRLDLLGGGDADTAGDDTFEVALAPETTATAGGAQDPSAAVSEDGGAFDRAESGGDTATGSDEGNGSATTAPSMTTAAPATTAAPGPSAVPDSLTLYSSQELESLPGLADLAAAIGDAKSLEAFGPPDEGNSRLEVIDEERCLQIGLNQAPDATEAFILALSGIDDVEVVIVAYVAPDFEIVTVLAHDLETCQILASSSP